MLLCSMLNIQTFKIEHGGCINRIRVFKIEHTMYHFEHTMYHFEHVRTRSASAIFTVCKAAFPIDNLRMRILYNRILSVEVISCFLIYRRVSDKTVHA